jgi:A118 family predicted phage portal protein
MSVIQEVSQVMIQRGYRVPRTTIYQKMREWVDFYQGEVLDFHRFNLKTIDGRNHTVKKPSLNVMKLVCETYSSLMWNENSKLEIDTTNQKILDEIIHDNNLYTELGVFFEKVAVYGTGVAIEYIANKKTKIGFSYGDTLVITDYHNTTPTGIVVLQRVMKNKKYYTHITINTFKDNVYRIEHEVYESKSDTKLGNKKDTLWPVFEDKESAKFRHTVKQEDGSTKIVYYQEYKTETPYFQVFKYNLANNFDFSPMGISVAANSVGLLKSIDDKFFSSIEDSINSRKKIFFDDQSSKSEVSKLYNEETDTIVNDYIEYLDRDQTLYKTAKLTDSDKKLEIYDPSYLPNTHKDAIQFDLNMLSLKCLLGKNYFNFDEGGVYVNEANVFSSNSDMWRNRQANANLVKTFLSNMLRAIVSLEKLDNKEYVVTLDDSMIINDEQRLEDMKTDANDGYVAKWRYVMERYGLSKEEAKLWVEEAMAEQPKSIFDVEEVEEETEEEIDGDTNTED